MSVKDRTTETVLQYKPRVVVVSRQGPSSIDVAKRKKILKLADVHYLQQDEAPEFSEAQLILKDTNILAATNTTLPRIEPRLFDALPKLSHIVLCATGSDHIDHLLLDNYAVSLTTLPSYATIAVAEHGIGMLFALAQRIHLANDVSRGLVHNKVSLRGVELYQKHLVIVGLGRIGLALAKIATGVGMAVSGVDVDGSARARAAELGIQILGFQQALERADAVAVAASRTYKQAPIFDSRAVHSIKDGAFLVNVGRPELIDHIAVAEALRSRRLRGYAVDACVFSPEQDLDLLTEGRVLQTNHSAWWRDEALDRAKKDWGGAILGAVESIVGRENLKQHSRARVP